MATAASSATFGCGGLAKWLGPALATPELLGIPDWPDCSAYQTDARLRETAWTAWSCSRQVALMRRIFALAPCNSCDRDAALFAVSRSFVLTLGKNIY